VVLDRSLCQNGHETMALSPDFLRLKYLFSMVDRSTADASKMDLGTEGMAEGC
jgi:hypothetical protein